MYIIIVGCGRVGGRLARLLSGGGHNVVVIDKDPSTFKNLGSEFNGLTVTGEGFDVDLLKEAGIEEADAFCAVTEHDNANIMSGQVAKKLFHIPKVIARINDAQYARVYEELGIDMVNSTELLASMIRNKLTDSSSTSFILKDPRLDTMKIVAQDKSFGKRVEELSLPGESVIVAILRNKNELRIARPKDIVNSGDLLIVVAKVESVAKVKKILGLVKGK